MKNSRLKVMSVTDAAAARVHEIIANADKPIVGLRVGVKNGGCAGMSYTMEFAESASPLDEVVEDKGVKLLIEPKALLFLLGAEMDFKVDRCRRVRFPQSQPDLGLRLRRERGDHAGHPEALDAGLRRASTAKGWQELFEPFAAVAVKRMFGGHGIYADGLCFAI